MKLWPFESVFRRVRGVYHTVLGIGVTALHQYPRPSEIHSVQSPVFEWADQSSGIEWSINPEPVAGINPVLTADDIHDYGDVNFVADPFFLPHEGRWHMFFEVCNYSYEPTAAIGHAVSPNGLQWHYDGIVLREPFHQSFPFVFRHHGEQYMIPEQVRPADDRVVPLYRAREFPDDWELVERLVEPQHSINDQVVFEYDDRWWLLVGDHQDGHLYAYFAEELTGEWRSHPENPVVSDRPHIIRPAGRPLVDENVTLFFQDCTDQYGDKVRVYEIESLSPIAYADREVAGSPLLEGTGGLTWNSGRMHHIDAWPTEQGFICAVDGDIGFGRLFTGDQWRIGIYSGG